MRPLLETITLSTAEPDTMSERWFDECELNLLRLRDELMGDAPTREDGDEPACALSASREALSSPNPFVSPRLVELAAQVGKRTEAQARAARMPQAEGLLQCIARQSGLDRAFAKIVGGQ